MPRAPDNIFVQILKSSGLWAEQPQGHAAEYSVLMEMTKKVSFLQADQPWTWAQGLLSKE